MANTTDFSSQGNDSLAFEAHLLIFAGNLSALQTIQAPAFVNSPSMRGTTTILWSCIVTLIACIYTALHLNVPGETGKLRALREKGKWVAIALVAPEVVLYLASSQFLEARRMAKELTQLWELSQGADGEGGGEGSKGQKLHEQAGFEVAQFDVKYGFFVIMGGLEVSVKGIEELWLQAPRGTLESGSLRLSVNGVLQLAKMGYFIHIPRSKIDDKSKADTLQKFLVIMQVFWMALQCIVRKAYGLPLSLLEVHTMIHVVCALVMYVFWIKKPKDLTDPEIVDSSEFDHLIALMVQEQFHSRKSEQFIFYPNNLSTRPGATNLQQSSPALVWVHNTHPSRQKFLRDDEDRIVPVRRINSITEGDYKLRLNVGEALPSGLGIVARTSAWETQRFQRRELPPGFPVEHYRDERDIPFEAYITVWVEMEPTPPSADLSSADVFRWERIITAIEEIEGSIRHPELFHPDHRHVRYPSEHYHDGFARDAGNLHYTGNSQVDPDQVLIFIFKSKILLILLLVLPALYGGIHLLVSNFEFPSPFEQRLWKIASIDIIGTVPVFFLLTFSGMQISKMCFDIDSGGEAFFALMYKLPGHILLIFYMMSRVYLVTESFISLRAVPIGVYWTPSWIQMLPHV